MTPQLIKSRDYLEHVTARVNNARHRVIIMTLIITDVPETAPLITALVRAASRNIPVSIGADFSAYSQVGGHARLHHAYSQPVRSITDMVNRFNSCGIDFRWLGQSGSFVFAGRTHSKWIVVDDHVYCFGGSNIDKDTLHNTDFMLSLEDAELASKLAAEHHRILTSDARGSGSRNHSFTHPLGTVLIDGGMPGRSLIYSRAATLAAGASSITLVSQYCPTGALAKTLTEKDATVYYNRAEGVEPFTKLLLKVSEHYTKLKNSYTRPPYLHAKFMIATYPDASKVAITGSHNFVRMGGLLGTREIALETHNPAIIAQLEKFLHEEVA